MLTVDRYCLYCRMIKTGTRTNRKASDKNINVSKMPSKAVTNVITGEIIVHLFQPVRKGGNNTTN